MSLFILFPRSSERGPIEAPVARFPGSRLILFPRSSERGPIEAESDVLDGLSHPTFPRSSERGPIEAFRTGTRSPQSRHFRAHQSAAPLKLVKIIGNESGDAEFPRSSERGPIEALRENPLCVECLKFPRSSERGPIEASCRSSAPPSACRISALIRARPH